MVCFEGGCLRVLSLVVAAGIRKKCVKKKSYERFVPVQPSTCLFFNQQISGYESLQSLKRQHKGQLFALFPFTVLVWFFSPFGDIGCLSFFTVTIPHDPYEALI